MIVVQIYIYNMLHLNIQSPFKHIEHIFLLIMNTAHGDIEWTDFEILICDQNNIHQWPVAMFCYGVMIYY
jgi:hypothetical protein